MSLHEHTIDALNELLEKNYDAVKGYENAADDVKNPQLKSFFHNRATQRAQFANEISTEIRNLNGEPKESGSAKAGLHRAWMDIKSTLSSDDSEATLEECIRGEKASVESYKEVIGDKEIPDNIKTQLGKHVMKIQTVLEEVKTLEDLH